MSWRTGWEWQTFQSLDPELIPPRSDPSTPLHEHQRRWLLPGRRHFDLSVIDGERVRLRILGAEKGDLQLWRSREYRPEDRVSLWEDLHDLDLVERASEDLGGSGWSSLEEALRERHRLKVIAVETALSSWSFAGCQLSQGRFVAGGHRSNVFVGRSSDRDALERLLDPRLRGLYLACDNVRALLDLLDRHGS